MSEKTNRPPLKWLLISSLGIVLVGLVPMVWYTSLPDDFHVGRKLQARGFEVDYDIFWRHPVCICGNGLNITVEDCRLISQLPHLESLTFAYGDVSELNFDEIGNCQKLEQVGFSNVTQFSINEFRKLTICPIDWVFFYNVDLTDSDLEVLTELKAEFNYIGLGDIPGITDAGLEHLEKIPHLYNLDITNTSVTEEGLEEFRKKRPDVNIIQLKIL